MRSKLRIETWSSPPTFPFPLFFLKEMGSLGRQEDSYSLRKNNKMSILLAFSLFHLLFCLSFLHACQMHSYFFTITLDQLYTLPKFNILSLQDRNIFLATYTLLLEEAEVEVGVWPLLYLARHALDMGLCKRDIFLFIHTDRCHIHKDTTVYLI